MTSAAAIDVTEPSLFEDIPAYGGFLKLAGGRPEIYGPAMQLCQAVMRGPGPLEPTDRELIAAYVSRKTGCTFCETSHTAIAKALGAEGAARILDEVPQPYAALFAFADRVIAQDVGRADLDALVAAGHDPAVADQIIHVVALFGFFNRVVSGYGFKSTPDMDAQIGQMMAKGYAMA